MVDQLPASPHYAVTTLTLQCEPCHLTLAMTTFSSWPCSSWVSSVCCGSVRWSFLTAGSSRISGRLHYDPPFTSSSFTFILPTHKSDTYFEGDKVLIQAAAIEPNPMSHMARYVTSRDKLFPFHPTLWLTALGNVPTRSWFLARLHALFPPDISGHSLRAGGATALALAGASPEIIKATGRWSSDAFERYIRKNPLLIHALILGRPSAFDGIVTPEQHS